MKAMNIFKLAAVISAAFAMVISCVEPIDNGEKNEDPTFPALVENYEVKNVVYDGGFKFKEIYGLFTEYMDYWSKEKINAKKDGNRALYLISKKMMNSLYGKFSKSPHVRSKKPFLDNDGIVRYEITDDKIEKGLYIPIGSFITSYARERTIRTSQSIRDYTLEKYGVDYYIYSDTLIVFTC